MAATDAAALDPFRKKAMDEKKKKSSLFRLDTTPGFLELKMFVGEL